MDPAELRRRFVDTFGLRIGSHTAEYVMKQLEAGEAFPVLAADARTGRAVRYLVDPETFNAGQPRSHEGTKGSLKA